MIDVLYIDDEEGLLYTGKVLLEKMGEFNITTAETVGDALDKLSSNTFDIIISDYVMPGMTGIQLLKKIRLEGNTTPFIVFTGRGREEVVIEALNAGADGYLQKGSDVHSQFAELAHKINITVDGYRAKAEEVNHKNFIEAIFDAIPGMLYVFDEDHNLIKCNKQFGSITGLSREELMSKTLIADHDARGWDNLAEAINKVFDVGYGEAISTIQCKGGKQVLMHLTGKRLYMNDKKYIVGIGTVIRTIATI